MSLNRFKLLLVFLGLCYGHLFAESSQEIFDRIRQTGDRGSSRLKAALYSDLGMAYYKEGKFTEAVKAFESALVFDTSRAQRRSIYVYLGKAYEAVPRLDKAISSYENAVLYDKRNWRRHRDLGGLYELADLPFKAQASYEKALALNSNETGLFLAMGRVWRKIGLYSYALPWLEKALIQNEHMQQVQEELSLVYEGQGEFNKAVLASEAGLGDPKRLIYLAILAGNPSLVKEGLDRLHKQGALKETRQVYENLVELSQHPPLDVLAGKPNNPVLEMILKNNTSKE